MGAEAPIFPAWTEADWRKAAEASLRGLRLEDFVSSSPDGIRVEPLYSPAAGPRALGPQGGWRVVARLDHPSAGEANAQVLGDIAGGAEGLQIVFSGAIGAYGFGLGLFDSATMHAAFDGVRFDAGLHFELDLGRGGAGEAMSFAALIERSGVEPSACAVAFNLDPFAACAHRAFPACWPGHADPYVEAALLLRANGFGGPLLVADSRCVHAAGGSPAQELAFAIAAGVALLRALEKAGLPLDEARKQIAFRLAADADQFVTLSKFRALRLEWARIEEACGLEPQKAYVQAETAWRMMTARDPYVNVMRGAIAAFSAGLGGADSVSVLPHTLAVGLPDSLARRLARNAQLILLRESNLGFVTDPAAGAGAFEALTTSLCQKGWGLFQEIEAEGGLTDALSSGAFQAKVAASAAALKRNAARLKAPITGISAHPDLAEAPADIAPAAPERGRIETEAGALAPMRLAEPFEAFRDESDAILARRGARPKAYLVALGAEPSHRRRVAFMREWFAAGGIEPVYGGEIATAAEAVERLETSEADFACLCGDDAAYATQAEGFAAAIEAAGTKSVILAGRPDGREALLRDAGVADFLFDGCDAIAALAGLYRRLDGEVPRRAS